MADLPASTATTAVVAIGGSYSNSLEVAGRIFSAVHLPTYALLFRRRTMFRPTKLSILLILMYFSCLSAGAQQLEKQHFHHNEWTKGRFSEVVTVTGPGKWLFLAGVGAEAEKDGSILHVGDFSAQCRYAYEKIGKLLAAHGGKMSDVVKLVTYVVDIKDRDAMNKCRAEAFKGGPLPVHTFLVISELARPGMVVEMDVIAVVPAAR